MAEENPLLKYLDQADAAPMPPRAEPEPAAQAAPDEPAQITDAVTESMKKIPRLVAEVRKVIVGLDDPIRKLLVAVLANGHVLLEGLPGQAKTLTVRTLAQAVRCIFSRVQFTPDIMPSDITGTAIYNQQTALFEVKKGPIFAHMFLADEINRSPPKVQSALLEAMQERRVTLAGQTFPLPKPFFVLATMNPVEVEGTYTLPEAQMDRFIFKLNTDYPSHDEELTILRRMTTGQEIPIEAVMTPEEIIRLQRFSSDGVYVSPEVESYVVDLVQATRWPSRYGLEDLQGMIKFGASPRATIYIPQAAKAMAVLNGRNYVIIDDVKEVGLEILKTRINLTSAAEGMDRIEIVKSILKAVPTP